MMKICLLSVGIGLGVVGALTLETSAQDRDERIIRGVVYSHNILEDFDMPIGVTSMKVPRKPEAIRQIREQLNVPSHYGDLISITGDSHTAILWYEKGGVVRNAIVERPDLYLYRLTPMPVTEFDDRLVR